MHSCTKSYTIAKSALGKQALFHSVTNLFLYQVGIPDKPRVLVLIPPGFSTININGTTTNSGLIVPCLRKLILLGYKNHAELVNEYSLAEIVITDEVLMVTSKLLYHIHKRLNELSSPVQNVPFGGESVLVCENI